MVEARRTNPKSSKPLDGSGTRWEQAVVRRDRGRLDSIAGKGGFSVAAAFGERQALIHAPRRIQTHLDLSSILVLLGEHNGEM